MAAICGVTTREPRLNYMTRANEPQDTDETRYKWNTAMDRQTGKYRSACSRSVLDHRKWRLACAARLSDSTKTESTSLTAKHARIVLARITFFVPCIL